MNTKSRDATKQALTVTLGAVPFGSVFPKLWPNIVIEAPPNAADSGNTAVMMGGL